ncbi:MAG TPA: hypothetical protein VFK87_05720, partial [Steroidobacteraceae bacterium]|nr:hypothetical protein [Steroidobacteraceae bacterium]
MPPAVLGRLAARFPARYPLLLDSAAHGPLGRTSLLLAEPRAALWLGADGRIGATGVEPVGRSFIEALENWWLSERTPEPAAAGQGAGDFAGGWALYLGYELAAEVEPLLALPRTPLPWVAYALRTPCALVHRLDTGRV